PEKIDPSENPRYRRVLVRATCTGPFLEVVPIPRRSLEVLSWSIDQQPYLSEEPLCSHRNPGSSPDRHASASHWLVSNLGGRFGPHALLPILPLLAAPRPLLDGSALDHRLKFH